MSSTIGFSTKECSSLLLNSMKAAITGSFSIWTNGNHHYSFLFFVCFVDVFFFFLLPSLISCVLMIPEECAGAVAHACTLAHRIWTDNPFTIFYVYVDMHVSNDGVLIYL